MEQKNIFKAIIQKHNKLLCGLGDCDFYFRTPKLVILINIPDAKKLPDIPIITSKTYGKGEYIFCGLAPDNFIPRSSDTVDYVSFIDFYTQHKAYRIIDTLLLNCGASFNMAEVFTKDQKITHYMKEIPSYDVNAFHNW